MIYKKCYGYLANKNPLSYILSFLKKNYNKYDLIHAHGYYFFTTLQCALFKKMRDFPFVLHIHGGIQTPYNPVSNLSENLQLLFKDKLFDKVIGGIPILNADRIISVADKDLKIINKNYGLNPNLSCHIPNGVDLGRFQRNENIQRRFITLVATRLSYIKGVDIFLKIIKELFKKNKNLEFLIIGDGPLKHMVFDAMKTLPIKYIPQYSYEKIQNIYNKSKLLLITSRSEGVPNILYESLACETHVISSNVGGISNVIADGENGYTYEIKNIKKIIPNILELIEDEEKLQEFGRNGRKLIEREYSWDVVTNKVFNIYKEMIG